MTPTSLFILHNLLPDSHPRHRPAALASGIPPSRRVERRRRSARTRRRRPSFGRRSPAGRSRAGRVGRKGASPAVRSAGTSTDRTADPHRSGAGGAPGLVRDGTRVAAGEKRRGACGREGRARKAGGDLPGAVQKPRDRNSGRTLGALPPNQSGADRQSAETLPRQHHRLPQAGRRDLPPRRPRSGAS